MQKQLGVTVLELLLGLGITSSMVAFTVEMANEVETKVQALNQERFHTQAIREKIKAQKIIKKDMQLSEYMQSRIQTCLSEHVEYKEFQ